MSLNAPLALSTGTSSTVPFRPVRPGYHAIGIAFLQTDVGDRFTCTISRDDGTQVDQTEFTTVNNRDNVPTSGDANFPMSVYEDGINVYFSSSLVGEPLTLTVTSADSAVPQGIAVFGPDVDEGVCIEGGYAAHSYPCHAKTGGHYYDIVARMYDGRRWSYKDGRPVGQVFSTVSAANRQFNDVYHQTCTHKPHPDGWIAHMADHNSPLYGIFASTYEGLPSATPVDLLPAYSAVTYSQMDVGPTGNIWSAHRVGDSLKGGAILKSTIVDGVLTPQKTWIVMGQSDDWFYPIHIEELDDGGTPKVIVIALLRERAGDRNWQGIVAGVLDESVGTSGQWYTIDGTACGSDTYGSLSSPVWDNPTSNTYPAGAGNALAYANDPNKIFYIPSGRVHVKRTAASTFRVICGLVDIDGASDGPNRYYPATDDDGPVLRHLIHTGTARGLSADTNPVASGSFNDTSPFNTYRSSMTFHENADGTVLARLLDPGTKVPATPYASSLGPYYGGWGSYPDAGNRTVETTISAIGNDSATFSDGTGTALPNTGTWANGQSLPVLAMRPIDGGDADEYMLHVCTGSLTGLATQVTLAHPNSSYPPVGGLSLPDVWEAIHTRLTGDTGTDGLAESGGTYETSFYRDEAPSNAPYPYIVWEVVPSPDDEMPFRDDLLDITVTFSVYDNRQSNGISRALYISRRLYPLFHRHTPAIDTASDWTASAALFNDGWSSNHDDTVWSYVTSYTFRISKPSATGGGPDIEEAA